MTTTRIYDPGEDPTLTVAAAYRAVRQQGDGDLPAYNAALDAFCDRHPETNDDEARERVGQIIFDASNRVPEWFWEGVSIGPRPRWY